MSDGELQEGSVWEAILLISSLKIKISLLLLIIMDYKAQLGQKTLTPH